MIRDLKLKEPYVGSTALVSGEIAEDVTEYFAVSEQIPTACALGVLVDTDQSVKAAGGYLIQLLPGAEEALAAELEQSIQAAGAVTAMLETGMEPEQMLQKVLGNLEFTVLQTQPVEYRCYCSRDRVRSALVALGREELREIVAQKENLTRWMSVLRYRLYLYTNGCRWDSGGFGSTVKWKWPALPNRGRALQRRF